MASPLTYLYFVDVHQTLHDRVKRSMGGLLLSIALGIEVAFITA